MILTYDDVLSPEDLKDYLHRVKFARFRKVTTQGIPYFDISQDVEADKLYDHLNKHLGFKVEDKLSFLRGYRSKTEYERKTWIHTDASFADYIGVFFVQSSEFPQDDGFALWRNKSTGYINFDKNNDQRTADQINSETSDPEKWELWKRIEYKRNRLVIVPASYYHSTATFGATGDTFDNCRIVHVLFFNKVDDEN